MGYAVIDATPGGEGTLQVLLSWVCLDRPEVH